MSVNKHLWISKSNNILPYLTNINIMTCLSCSINFAIQINNNCAGHANKIYSKICYLESHLAAARACSPISCGSLGGISPLNLVLWTGLRQTEDHQMSWCAAVCVAGGSGANPTFQPLVHFRAWWLTERTLFSWPSCSAHNMFLHECSSSVDRTQ